MDGLLHRPGIKRHTFDVAAYYRMAELGILTERDRVELIEGELIDMAPIGPEHAGAGDWLLLTLFRAVGDAALPVANRPLRLDDFSEPQPDVMLLRPRADGYRGSHPRPPDVFLLIELARSSLLIDREVKRPLYAGAGIVEYWIVDFAAAAVDVHRTPQAGAYASIVPHGRDATIAPLAFPDLRLRVADILG